MKDTYKRESGHRRDDDKGEETNKKDIERNERRDEEKGNK